MCRAVGRAAGRAAWARAVGDDMILSCGWMCWGMLCCLISYRVVYMYMFRLRGGDANAFVLLLLFRRGRQGQRQGQEHRRQRQRWRAEAAAGERGCGRGAVRILILLLCMCEFSGRLMTPSPSCLRSKTLALNAPTQFHHQPQTASSACCTRTGPATSSSSHPPSSWGSTSSPRSVLRIGGVVLCPVLLFRRLYAVGPWFDCPQVDHQSTNPRRHTDAARADLPVGDGLRREAPPLPALRRQLPPGHGA